MNFIGNHYVTFVSIPCVGFSPNFTTYYEIQSDLFMFLYWFLQSEDVDAVIDKLVQISMHQIDQNQANYVIFKIQML